MNELFNSHFVILGIVLIKSFIFSGFSGSSSIIGILDAVDGMVCGHENDYEEEQGCNFGGSDFINGSFQLMHRLVGTVVVIAIFIGIGIGIGIGIAVVGVHGRMSMAAIRE